MVAIYIIGNACLKGTLYDSVNKYKYVLVKKTNANTCALTEIFPSKILRPVLTFYSGCGL